MIGDAIAITRVVEARHEAWRALAGLATAIAVLLLACTVLGLLRLLNRRVAVPIEQLAEATVAIGSGDLDRRVAVTGTEEVTLLSRSFDRMRASLKEQNQRRSEFLAMLSHELRNPLAPIRTSVHVLERTGVAHPAAQKALDILKVQTAHLARIVGDLLDTNRSLHGALELRTRWTDLRRIALDVVAANRATAVENFQEIVCNLPTEPVGVRGDPDRLRQIVSNLVQNAIRFGRPGTVVRVGLSVGDDHCELCVSDEGDGIPPAMLERIFEPFFQAPQPYSRPKGGLGLGLALVKNLTEMHGGSVRAESPGVGRGAGFFVRLPLAPRPSSEQPAPTD
jgi:signal transduction histidine kinase